MAHKIKKLIIIPVILLLIFTVSCSSTDKIEKKSASEDQSSQTTSEQKKFDEFTDKIFVNDIQTNTISLHYTLSDPESYGITDYPVTLGDLSSENSEKNKLDLESTLNTLTQFDYDGLTSSQQITYDILYDYVNTELGYSDLSLYNEPLSSTLGEQAQLPVLFAEYYFNSKKDIDNYLLLLADIEPYFTKLIAYEKQKVTAGLFMSDEMADSVIAQCNNFISDPEQNYLIDVFNEKTEDLDSLSQKEKDFYKEQNKNIVINKVIPAYRSLIDELTLLKGNGKNSGGLCNFEQGKEYYEYLIKSCTGSSKTINELEDKINKKIKSDLQEMSMLVVKNPDLLDQVSSYSFAQTEPQDIISTLIDNMTKDFPKAPEVKYSFKYVHESLEKDLSPAFYLIPPIDDYKNNVIYINGSDQYSQQDLFTTIAHEGYPGHLYQTTYFDSTNPSPIRSILSNAGYVEGWATYTEIYSYSFSNLSKEMASFLALNTSYALGIYSRIDIGVNYNGWTLEQVSSYLTDIGITDSSIAKQIFNSMVENPGNYLNYYVGYLEILELRDIAKESLGDNFVLKDFHEFLLNTGPAPFEIILKHMNIWISNL